MKEIVWKGGEMAELREWYLNGNLKLEESYRGPKKQAGEGVLGLGQGGAGRRPGPL